MKAHTRPQAWMCGILVTGLAVAAQAQSSDTQPAELSPPATAPADAAAKSATGVVTGDNVYVRSGFAQTYYPVIKLNRGDRGTVVGEEFGWLEILPPAATFSLVDKTYVDRVGDDAGVINGRTWVHAGSLLSDSHYAKQVQLDKGDRVKILGETSDAGFLKIASPSGAHLYIKGDFVDRSGRTADQLAGPQPSGIEPIRPGELDLDRTTPALSPGVTPPDRGAAGIVYREGSPPPAVPEPEIVNPTVDASDKYQLQINAIEAEVAAESTKPLAERNFQPIIEKLQPLAQQSDDEVAKLYAESRIKQLGNQRGLASAIGEIRRLRDEARESAERFAQERVRIRSSGISKVDDIVVRGNILVSGIYNGTGSRPKRWRIVEPDTRKTLAYIQLPEGSPLNPVDFYGKYVGVRALAYDLLEGSIPPLPVYTVDEIVVQDPERRSDRPARAGSRLSASPLPAELPAASTQPSGTDFGEPRFNTKNEP